MPTDTKNNEMKTKWLPTQSSTEILRGSETHRAYMQTHKYTDTCRRTYKYSTGMPSHAHKHTLPPQSTLTHVYKRTYTQTCTQTHTQGHRKEVGYKQQIIFKQLFGKNKTKTFFVLDRGLFSVDRPTAPSLNGD